MKKEKQKIKGILQIVFLILVATVISHQSFAQNVVSGIITATTGEPVPGATIVLKGTSVGTVSDGNGSFSINAKSGDILIFSFIGMKSKEITVTNQTSLDIELEQDVIGLEEVVAVGYGTMKKSDLTGSAVSADIEAFRESPNINIMQALQGAVPGVQIGQTNQAGEEASISIRGTSTINGNTDVLIILDGIVYRGDITRLNPNDIQSIDVLKDASSKAIYGAQAANGVILITTKSGKKNSKTAINYSISVSSQTPTVNARLLNREEFLQKVKDICYEDAYLSSDYTEENPDWDYSQSELNSIQLTGIDNGTDTDWWGAATSPGNIIDHTLSFSGGNEKTTYHISGGHTNQKGFVMNDKFKRSTVRINFQTEVNRWLTIGTNTFGSFTNYSGISPGMSSLARMSPLCESKDEDGDYIIYPHEDAYVNPFLNAMADDKDLRNDISGNFYAIISIPKIEGLSYRINYNNDYRWTYHAYSNEYDEGQVGAAYKENSSNYDRTLDNILSYEKQINENHNIQATLVYGINIVNYEYTNASGENYSNLDLSYNSLQQATTQNIESSAWKESSLYQMGRLNYNYRNKYLLTTTLRRDGFSGFSQNNKFGVFPSVGIGWVLSEEEFYNIPKMEYLKLRMSYGKNGNLTSRYSSLASVEADDDSKYVFGDGSSTSIGQSPSSLANSDLTWETTTGFNMGIDFGVLDNRIRGNIEYYRTTTTDLLWDMTLPEMTGFSEITTNLGKVANTGLEFSIFATPVRTTNFRWDINVNFSTNKNEIKELLGIDSDGDGKEDDLTASGLFIGKSIGAIYNYEIDGIWQLDDDILTGYYPGTYRIVDQEVDGVADGVISADNDRKILGKTEPAYRFGIQNTLAYKNFTLRFFINSIQGGKNGFLKANEPYGGTTGTAQNLNWFNLFNNDDYWTPRNPNAKYCQPWLTPSIEPDRYQSRSFVRLQDISLSYKLKSSFTEKLGISDAKIYISGKNLLTFTKWDGWDPETGQTINTSDNYPVMKSYSMGVDISF